VSIGGSIPERLQAITDHYDLPRVITIEEAVARAQVDYDLLDVRDEKERELAHVLT